MRVGAFLRAWLPVVVAAGVLLVGGLVAIPLGGWDTVQLRSAVLPEHPIGQPYDGHRVSTAIDDIYLLDEHPDGYTEAGPGETFLVVIATMEAMTDEPKIPLGSKGFYAFTVPGLFGLEDRLDFSDYWVRLVRDDTNGATLSPGVPDTVMFVFLAPDDLFEEGDEIAIGLTEARPESADLYTGTRWAAPHVAVEVHAVIRDGR